MESSDVQVTIEPADDEIRIDLSSSVIEQYGRRIREVVTETLARLGVRSARVFVVDKGALDCIIRARVECAVFRASGAAERIPWGGVVSE